MSNNLALLTKQEIDPVSLVMNRARLRGMESFLTFRMNELHDVDKPESPLLSPFWKAHPNGALAGTRGGEGSSQLCHTEVREYFFAILKKWSRAMTLMVWSWTSCDSPTTSRIGQIP